MKIAEIPYRPLLRWRAPRPSFRAVRAISRQVTSAAQSAVAEGRRPADLFLVRTGRAFGVAMPRSIVGEWT